MDNLNISIILIEISLQYNFVCHSDIHFYMFTLVIVFMVNINNSNGNFDMKVVAHFAIYSLLKFSVFNSEDMIKKSISVPIQRSRFFYCEFLHFRYQSLKTRLFDKR